MNRKSFGNWAGGFLAAAILILFSFVSAQAAVNITIDGNVSDWAEVTALGTDADDMTDNDVDVKAVYAANDNDNLYLRADVYGNIERNGNYYIIYLDTDQNTETGLTFGWWATGADYRVYIDEWSVGLQKFMGTNPSDNMWGWDEALYAVKNISVFYSGGVVECAVPRLDIGETGTLDEVNILFRVWPGDDGIPYYNAAPMSYNFKINTCYYGYDEDGSDSYYFINNPIPANLVVGDYMAVYAGKYHFKNVFVYLLHLFDKDNNGNGRLDIEEESYWPVIFKEIESMIGGYESNVAALYIVDEPYLKPESRSAWLETDDEDLDFDKIKFTNSGDYNGDGKDDLAMFHDGGDLGTDRQKIYVSISSGATFNDKVAWFDMHNDWFNFNYVDFVVKGDFTGDGKDDVAMFYDYFDTGGDTAQKVLVYSSTGSTFHNRGAWINTKKSDLDFDKIKFVNSGDYNGDGKADIAMFYQEGAPNYRQKIYVCTSNGAGFNSKATWFDMPPEWFRFDYVDFAVTGDFTGDGKSDVAMFYDYFDTGGDTTQKVLVYGSTGSTFHNRGAWINTKKSDLDFDKFKFVVSGERDDYNADGLDDICMFCDYPADGPDPFDDRPQREFVYLSSGSLGSGGFIDHRAWLNEPAWSIAFRYVDFAVCGDFTGDGLDDIAYFYDYGSGDQKIFVGRSTGRGAFTNRALLEKLVAACKNRFSNIPVAINFTRMDVMLDNTIPKNIDLIATDPYPFFKHIPQYPDPNAKKRYDTWVNTAMRKLKNDFPDKPILLFGQSFSNDAWRMPLPEEEMWFYDTVKNFGLSGIIWFKYNNATYGTDKICGIEDYPELIEVHTKIGNAIVNGIPIE